MNNEKKTIIIQDSINLPVMKEIGWGEHTAGPIMHPFMASDDLIYKLITASSPVRFMYALNPTDLNMRRLISLDNYTKSNSELFDVVEEPIAINVESGCEGGSCLIDPVEKRLNTMTKAEVQHAISETREVAKSVICAVQDGVTAVSQTLEEATNEIIADGSSVVDDISKITDVVEEAVGEIIANVKDVVEEAVGEIIANGTVVIADVVETANDINDAVSEVVDDINVAGADVVTVIGKKDNNYKSSRHNVNNKRV